MKIKLNMPMQGYEAGREVAIECDRSGVPLEKFWRRRLKDAQIDNCLEVVKPSKSKKEQGK